MKYEADIKELRAAKATAVKKATNLAAENKQLKQQTQSQELKELKAKVAALEEANEQLQQEVRQWGLEHWLVITVSGFAARRCPRGAAGGYYECCTARQWHLTATA